MKLRNKIFFAIACTLGWVSFAHASSNYYLPERILCKLDDNNRIACKEFNRSYFVEETTNANLTHQNEDVFHFVSAVAYFSSDRTESTIFVDYGNAHFQNVKLKNVNTSMRPDLENVKSEWVKLNDDIYTCDAGYMNCPITNLPSF